MKQKWEDELNQSLNQMTGMTLEESRGPCGFAFPAGDLTSGGQGAFVPRHMEARSREKWRPMAPVSANFVFSCPTSDLWWP